MLEFTGDDVHKVSHAYGVNGIITEVEMPLAPAHDWVDVIIGFDDFTAPLPLQRALASGRHPQEAARDHRGPRAA